MTTRRNENQVRILCGPDGTLSGELILKRLKMLRISYEGASELQHDSLLFRKAVVGELWAIEQDLETLYTIPGRPGEAPHGKVWSESIWDRVGRWFRRRG